MRSFTKHIFMKKTHQLTLFLCPSNFLIDKNLDHKLFICKSYTQKRFSIK